MKMQSIYDAIGIEIWRASDISGPFYIWPLSESSIQCAAAIGLLQHPQLKGFIDSCRQSFPVDSRTFEAVRPTPEIIDTIYVLSILHGEEISRSIGQYTRCSEYYLLGDNSFFTHIRNNGDARVDKRTAFINSSCQRLLEVLPKEGWPEGSDAFKKSLRNGMECISTAQVEKVLDFIDREKYDVVYYSVPAYFDFVRQSIYLRQEKIRTLLITISENFSKGKEAYFDAVIQCDGNHFLALAYALLTRCDILHIRGWMTQYMTAATLAALASSKTVVELMDIPEFLCNRETYANLYDADMAHDDFESFPVIFNQAGGVLSNHHKDAIRKLTEKYNSTSKVLQYHSYVCDEFCAQEDILLTKPYSIVYAGTLIPSSFPHAYLGVCQLLPLIQKLTRAGLRFTVYGNPFISLREQTWDYLFESRTNPLFSMTDGGPPGEATKQIAKHHFGLLMYIFEGVDVGRYHFMNLPTKMTLYLEAGLPLLVSEELEYVADVVRKNGIGIVVSQSDIDVIAKIIENCDYTAMRQNILKFRNSFNSKIMISRLIDFYQRL